MAMPLRSIPPASSILAEEKGARRLSPAFTVRGTSDCGQSLGLFSLPKPATWCSRFLPPLLAASDSAGTTSAVTSEGLKGSLESVEVYDITGKAIRLTDLWKERKAIIAFARHFGCVFCRKRADLLAAKKELMDAAGVALVLIGPGSTEQAKTFVEQTKFKGGTLLFIAGKPYYFDEARGSGIKIVQLYLEGYRQDWELSFQKGTVSRGGWQQGGILVAGPGVHNILYIHRDKEAGDDPEIEEVLKACCS